MGKTQAAPTVAKLLTVIEAGATEFGYKYSVQHQGAKGSLVTVTRQKNNSVTMLITPSDAGNIRTGGALSKLKELFVTDTVQWPNAAPEAVKEWLVSKGIKKKSLENNQPDTPEAITEKNPKFRENRPTGPKAHRRDRVLAQIRPAESGPTSHNSAVSLIPLSGKEGNGLTLKQLRRQLTAEAMKARGKDASGNGFSRFIRRYANQAPVSKYTNGADQPKKPNGAVRHHLTPSEVATSAVIRQPAVAEKAVSDPNLPHVFRFLCECGFSPDQDTAVHELVTAINAINTHSQRGKDFLIDKRRVLDALLHPDRAFGEAKNGYRLDLIYYRIAQAVRIQRKGTGKADELAEELFNIKTHAITGDKEKDKIARLSKFLHLKLLKLLDERRPYIHTMEQFLISCDDNIGYLHQVLDNPLLAYHRNGDEAEPSPALKALANGLGCDPSALFSMKVWAQRKIDIEGDPDGFYADLIDVFLPTGDSTIGIIRLPDACDMRAGKLVLPGVHPVSLLPPVQVGKPVREEGETRRKAPITEKRSTKILPAQPPVEVRKIETPVKPSAAAQPKPKEKEPAKEVAPASKPPVKKTTVEVDFKEVAIELMTNYLNLDHHDRAIYDFAVQLTGNATNLDDIEIDIIEEIETKFTINENEIKQAIASVKVELFKPFKSRGIDISLQKINSAIAVCLADRKRQTLFNFINGTKTDREMAKELGLFTSTADIQKYRDHILINMVTELQKKSAPTK